MKKKLSKIKKYIIITSMFFIIKNQAQADIREISDLVHFENFLKEVGQDTLVIFDIDYVLMMPDDDYTLSRNPYRKKLWQALQTKLSAKEIELLQSIITSNAKWRMVDSRVSNVFADLRKNCIPTVALTSFSTGKFGILEKREELRMQDLKALGFEFSYYSPFKENFIMHELASNYGAPMLIDGVIFTAELDKALILEHILSSKNYQPTTIIFIDDQLKNLESVEKLCSKLNIKYYGFHYIAASLLPPAAFNKEAEDLRMRRLQEEHRWIIED